MQVSQQPKVPLRAWLWAIMLSKPLEHTHPPAAPFTFLLSQPSRARGAPAAEARPRNFAPEQKSTMRDVTQSVARGMCAVHAVSRQFIPRRSFAAAFSHLRAATNDGNCRIPPTRTWMSKVRLVSVRLLPIAIRYIYQPATLLFTQLFPRRSHCVPFSHRMRFQH